MSNPGETNHLRGEKSLYLRQHAGNPVDWYPWGEEAFAKARSEGKPIFLSIGYSACHWCHVMARESFKDEYVAGILNRSYVSIKVDREERPDLDAVYMLACQMISGGGGWPLTIIATPEGKPFFAGTYFRKGGDPSGPGLLDILMQLDSKWRMDRGELMRSAEEISAALREFASYREPAELSKDIERECYQAMAAAYDERNGGFEIAPKFPSPHRLIFLLRYWASSGEKAALDMAISTLDHISMGGISDQLGGGLHRYSTDMRWLLPHFEKMLYDQALMALACAEAFEATDEERFKRAALKVLSFVRREMTSTDGGFYSAIGADSEGEEGKYYLWRYEEVKAGLSPEELELLAQASDLRKEGNVREEATGRRTGKNVLHMAMPLDALADSRGIPAEKAASLLQGSFSKLYARREQRPRPDTDDKVLADWNGLMIAAYARCSRAFGDAGLAEAAEKAADLVLDRMSMGQGRLYHRLVGGQAAIPGFVEDLALMAWGLTELYLASLDSRHLRSAVQMAEAMIAHHRDKADGGFFFTADDGERTLARTKDAHDGAMPSGNSMAACLLVRLARLTRQDRYADLANATIKAFAADLNSNPMAHAQMLQALHSLAASGRTIVVAGDKDDMETKMLMDAAKEMRGPELLTILNDSPDAAELTGTGDLSRVDGRATAYIIQGGQVSAPLSSADELRGALSRR